jgi:outer membrane protein
MKVKYLFGIIFFSIVGFIPAQNKSLKGSVTIGIVVDGEWDLNKAVLDNLEKELKVALEQQASITIPRNKILIGDWTLKKISELNNKLLADDEIDIVIGYGVLASYDLAHRNILPKPVIAPVIIDTSMQKIKSVNGTSGIKNLSYLLFPGTYERDIKLFKEIVGFKNLVLLQSKSYHTELSDSQLRDEVLSKEFNINIKKISIGDDVKEFLNSIPVNTDAVYIDVLPISREKIRDLANGLKEKRLPSFSFFGEMDVRDGVMAAANPDIFPRLARRIGMNIQRIILGEDAGTLSIFFSAAKKTFINLQTAFSVGVSPKWSTLLEAEIIEIESPDYKDAATYSLDDVIKKIENENLDVLSKIQEIAASYQNIPIARSNLFPRIDLSMTGLKIDSDRALAGSQPENKIYADATISQVIFSEPALANLSIQNSLYESKLNELEAFKQTTILEGSKLFLNYLRARKIYQVILENLKLLRINLEIAQNRESIGAAGPEEPLRWEAEVAGLRKAAMEVQSQMNQVQLALKQMLNIPLVYLINTKEITLDNETMLISDKKFQRLLEDPLRFDQLTDFLVGYGIGKSADLRMIQNIIDARERRLTSMELSHFVPTLAAFGTFTKTLYKSEIKSPFSFNFPSPPSTIPPDIPVYLGQIFSGFSIPLPNDLDWNVGIQLSLNLFNGMGTTALRQQSDIEVKQLMVQKKSIEEKIALGIRAEMENLKARYFGIKQSQIQVEAEDKTLKIVSDSYSRGAIPILFLLDAQSSALNAQQVSANALYDLFISYLQLQRLIGQYEVLLTKEERELFLNDMIRFVSKVTRED